MAGQTESGDLGAAATEPRRQNERSRRTPASEGGLSALRWMKERFTNRYRKGALALPESDRARIESMVEAIEAGPAAARPSLYWRKLNRMNIEQLYYTGYENFKRTLALNYFTFVNILPWDPQISALLSTIPARKTLRFAGRALVARSAEFYSSVNWIQTRIYHFMTLSMRERIMGMRLDPRSFTLEEPTEGGAIPVFSDDGRMISADLCNSLLEYHVASTAIRARPKTILELGGGYGRTAFVWATLSAGSKYIMVDIAPALWVAERYLPSVLENRKLFRWRPFTDFADVANEFDSADLCFLTPDQLQLLPEGSVDLVLNISSLHEMTLDKIQYFITHFDRLLTANGHFYLKAWKRSVLPVDNVIIARDDYPIPDHWSVVVERTPEFQPTFFEAVFKKVR